MITIIICWIALFFVIFQIGRLILSSRLLKALRIKEKVEWYEYFWVGFAGIIAILQIWSIFLPVNIFSLAFVFILAIISFIINPKIRVQKQKLSFIVLSSLILLVISYFASLTVGWGDSNLYHLNAVRWSNTFAVVPGLANLHSRLGFNSSFFLFASMVDNWFLKDRSSHVALSLLVSVLSVEMVWILLEAKNRLNKLFCLFIMPLLICCIVSRTIIASPSPDLALIVLVYAISIEFLKGRRGALIISSLLSLLLITVKQNSIVFAAAVLIFVTLKIKKNSVFLLLATAGMIILIPYIIRNIVLSGWPLYPLPLFGFNVPWAVPEHSVRDMFKLIKTWAILPGPNWRQSADLSFFQWFPGWFSRNWRHPEIFIFLFGAIFFMLSPLTKIFHRLRFRELRNYLLLGMAAFISVLYVLFTAPDFRFVEVYIWVFFAISASICADLLITKNKGFIAPTILLGVCLILFVSLPLRIDGAPILRSIRWEFSGPVEKITIVPRDGSPSFRVLKPLDDLCSNSDLPCTPELNNIKEMVPGDISKGFAPVR